ncbi:MAG: DUF4293 domain-containing protein [Paludibacteraceae bacterium]|nr:DUF4293 domain-containing protein [Paludibacteraceae bacterium]
MIQRIQTLYLLAIVALGIALIFLPVAELVTNEFQVYELGAFRHVPLEGLWGLAVTTILIPALAFVDIFLFKKRVLQARLNIFLAILCLGYYGILFMYIWFAKMNFAVEWNITFWACIPLICFILTLMATRRILKDEALVRAADRIR